MLKTALAFVLPMLLAPPLFAQTTEPTTVDPTTTDPSAAATVHFGRFALRPTLALTNAGVDTNVFYEPAQENPKSDFTATVTPATDLWLRLGKSWLTGTVKEDLVYYRQYASERSVNGFYDAGLLVPLNRVIFNGGGSYLDTRDRPGFEISARDQRYETRVNGSVEVRTLPKTFFGVRVERATIDFAQAAVFLGTSLQQTLNRTTTTAAFTARHRLTPLTTLTLDVAREQDRFEFSPIRDSDSTSVTAGVKFDPFALIKGSAWVGYRSFTPLLPGTPAFNGVIADGKLWYVLGESTRIDVEVQRDLQYSYDTTQPYYIQTGFNGSLDQHLFGQVDIVGRAGQQRLAYTDSSGVAAALVNRIDHVYFYGGGVGYRVARRTRVGFNIDQVRRTSVIEALTYNGLRYGIAVTYGS
jgi:hypothetical protein